MRGFILLHLEQHWRVLQMFLSFKGNCNFMERFLFPLRNNYSCGPQAAMLASAFGQKWIYFSCFTTSKTPRSDLPCYRYSLWLPFLCLLLNPIIVIVSVQLGFSQTWKKSLCELLTLFSPLSSFALLKNLKPKNKCLQLQPSIWCLLTQLCKELILTIQHYFVIPVMFSWALC